MNDTQSTRSPATPCRLMRRLAVMLYDGLLLVAVLFISVLPVLALTGGDAVAAGNVLFEAYLVMVCFLFFAWFWTHGGQTLGMKTWRVRLRSDDGSAVSWRQALIRFLAAVVSWAALGIGFLWSLADPQKRAWHDIWSGTVLVVEPRVKRGKR